MRFEQLYYYLAVCDKGSMNAACSKLHLTYQSLHTAIQNFEQEIGVQLLIRTNRGISMTPAGEKVYRQAKATLNDWQSLVQELRCEAPSNLHGSLTLKTMELFNKALLPQMGIYFLTKYPKVKMLSVPPLVDSYANIIKAVASGAIDLGFVNVLCDDACHLPELARNVHFHPLLECSWYLWVNSRSPLIKQESLDLESLGKYPLAFLAGTDPDFYQQFFDEYPQLLERAVFYENPHMLSQLVHEGLAACLDIKFGKYGLYLADDFYNKEAKPLPVITRSKKQIRMGYLASNKFEKKPLYGLIEQYFAPELQFDQ